MTVALQELVSMGHRLGDVWDVYPATVVKGLLAASRLQQRYRMAEHVISLSVAVTGALDLVLNRGKGEVLERWSKEMFDDFLPKSKQKKRPRISERAMSFFERLPHRSATGGSR